MGDVMRERNPAATYGKERAFVRRKNKEYWKHTLIGIGVGVFIAIFGDGFEAKSEIATLIVIGSFGCNLYLSERLAKEIRWGVRDDEIALEYVPETEQGTQ